MVYPHASCCATSVPFVLSPPPWLSWFHLSLIYPPVYSVFFVFLLSLSVFPAHLCSISHYSLCSSACLPLSLFVSLAVMFSPPQTSVPCVPSSSLVCTLFLYFTSTFIFYFFGSLTLTDPVCLLCFLFVSCCFGLWTCQLQLTWLFISL